MYTIKRASELLDRKARTEQDKCKEYGYKKTKGRYTLNLSQLKELAHWFYPQEDTIPEELLVLLDHANNVDSFNTKRNTPQQNETKRNETLESVSDSINLHAEELSRLQPPIRTQEEIDAEAIETVNALAMKQGLKPTYYTDEEYTELIGELATLKILKVQVEELKEQNKELREMLKDGLSSIQKALNNIGERNYMEAKEKGIE